MWMPRSRVRRVPFALPLKLPMPLMSMFGASGSAATPFSMLRVPTRTRASFTSVGRITDTSCAV